MLTPLTENSLCPLWALFCYFSTTICYLVQKREDKFTNAILWFQYEPWAPVSMLGLRERMMIWDYCQIKCFCFPKSITIRDEFCLPIYPAFLIHEFAMLWSPSWEHWLGVLENLFLTVKEDEHAKDRQHYHILQVRSYWILNRRQWKFWEKQR